MYCDVKRRTKIIIRPVGTKQYLIRLGVTKQYVIRPGGPNNMYACRYISLNNVRWFNKNKCTVIYSLVAVILQCFHFTYFGNSQ